MFYKKILDYCKENDLSISAFEKKCGIGNGTTGKWKNGTKPSLNTLGKISRETGISISELLDMEFAVK